MHMGYLFFILIIAALCTVSLQHDIVNDSQGIEQTDGVAPTCRNEKQTTDAVAFFLQSIEEKPDSETDKLLPQQHAEEPPSEQADVVAEDKGFSSTRTPIENHDVEPEGHENSKIQANVLPPQLPLGDKQKMPNALIIPKRRDMLQSSQLKLHMRPSFSDKLLYVLLTGTALIVTAPVAVLICYILGVEVMTESIPIVIAYIWGYFSVVLLFEVTVSAVFHFVVIIVVAAFLACLKQHREANEKRNSRNPAALHRRRTGVPTFSEASHLHEH